MNRFTQTEIPGDQYSRAKRIILENPKDGVPSMTCAMEAITNTADGKYVKSEEGLLISAPPTSTEDALELVTLYGLDGQEHGKIPRGEMLEKLMLFINSEMIHSVIKTQRKAQEELRVQEELKTENPLEALINKSN